VPRSGCLKRNIKGRRTIKKNTLSKDFIPTGSFIRPKYFESIIIKISLNNSDG
jgi:hypothetical protein